MLSFCIRQNNIQKLPRCNNKSFNRKMFNVACYKKSIFLLAFFHNHFIKHPVLLIGQFNVISFCIDKYSVFFDYFKHIVDNMN